MVIGDLVCIACGAAATTFGFWAQRDEKYLDDMTRRYRRRFLARRAPDHARKAAELHGALGVVFGVFLVGVGTLALLVSLYTAIF
jgi:hypothetical protein